MTTVIDLGQSREQEMRNDALAERDRRAHPNGAEHDRQLTVADSALVCAMCESEIPEGRRRAIPGVQFCVECKTDIEKRTPYDWGMAE